MNFGNIKDEFLFTHNQPLPPVDGSSLSPGQLRIFRRHPELGPLLLLERVIFTTNNYAWCVMRDGDGRHYYTERQLVQDTDLIVESI